MGNLSFSNSEASATSRVHIRRQLSGITSADHQHHRGRIPILPISGLGEQAVPLVTLSMAEVASAIPETGGRGQLGGNVTTVQSLQNVLQDVLDMLPDDEF